ncbi:MAG: GNAT family N-acetyltransferase [Saprospiraceae bacterium]|nr:GNAT family N-acetyltransferase [Saprospiraceae bacterium]
MTIFFREIAREDLPIINRWRNDRAVIDFLGNTFIYINQEIDNRWFDAYLQNRQTAVRWAICVQNDVQTDVQNEKNLTPTPLNTEGVLTIGTVQLTNIHALNRNAEFSIMIGDKNYWSRGVGEQAAREMVRHGFQDLNLHRIYLYVLPQNTRAIKLYEKIGFQTEGILRGSIFKNGDYQDLILMAILK